MKYRSEIDGLRAVAVLPVIFYHAGFKAFEGGFIGVDVFFVISGYLITTIILSDMDKGKFSIVVFYERRARRIMPALFFVMLCCLPFAWAWLLPNDLKDFSQSIAAVSLFSSNFLFWQESGYFSAAAELKPLLHTWSLSVEEQYYVIFPLFLILLYKLNLRKRLIFGVLAVVAAISLWIAQWSAYNEPTTGFFLLHTRAWELSIGGLVALYFLYRDEKINNLTSNKVMNEVLSFLGLFLITFAVFNFDKSTPFPSLYALIPTIGAAIIILFSGPHTIVGRILSIRIMVGIGLISYSTYLWHQPLFVFARYRSSVELSFISLLCLSVLSIIIAYFCWRYVELPFRNKDLFCRKRIFSITALGSLVFFIFGFVGHWQNGFYDRYSNDVQLALHSTSPSPKRNDCHSEGDEYIKPSNACRYFNDIQTWAVFGDSHGIELAYSLAKKLNVYGDGVYHFTNSACEPTLNFSDKEDSCAQWTDETLKYITTNKEIQNVVVAYRINAYLYGDHLISFPVLPDSISKKTREIRWRSYINILEMLIENGKNVYLVLQAPELPRHINVFLKESLYNKDGIITDIKGVDRDWWGKRTEYITEHIGQIPSQVHIIDPADLFCEGGDCFAVRNGISYYFDDDHPSVLGADLISGVIMKNWNVPSD